MTIHPFYALRWVTSRSSGIFVHSSDQAIRGVEESAQALE